MDPKNKDELKGAMKVCGEREKGVKEGYGAQRERESGCNDRLSLITMVPR